MTQLIGWWQSLPHEIHILIGFGVVFIVLDAIWKQGVTRAIRKLEEKVR